MSRPEGEQVNYGILNADRPSPRSDASVAHGLVVKGRVHRLGHWVPDFAYPALFGLVCTDAGKSALVQERFSGLGDFQPIEVWVAEARMNSLADVVAAKDLFDEEVARATSRRGRLLQCHAVQGVATRCSYSEVKRADAWVACTTPKASFESDFGRVVPEDPQGREVVDEIHPRFLASAQLVAFLESRLPGWFKLGTSLLG